MKKSELKHIIREEIQILNEYKTDKALYKKVSKFLDNELRDEDIDSAQFQFAIMYFLRGALIDANFDSEAKSLPKIFKKGATYQGKYNKMTDILQSDGEKIAKWAEWDLNRIIESFSFYLKNKGLNKIGDKLKELKI